jgi:AcrR family transcriptional regulator
LTRAAVIDAARTLFLERGYAVTTVEAISDLSGASPATVYRLFSSKLGILKGLLDVSLIGDSEAVEFAERPDVRAVLTDPDPRSRLAVLAGVVRDVMSRIIPLYRIMVSAAASDPDAATLLADYTRRRQQGQARVARSLARSHALRPTLRERDAADIIHALTSPEVYYLLTTDRSWTPERYEQWLTGILVDQLLADP